MPPYIYAELGMAYEILTYHATTLLTTDLQVALTAGFGSFWQTCSVSQPYARSPAPSLISLVADGSHSLEQDALLWV